MSRGGGGGGVGVYFDWCISNPVASKCFSVRQLIKALCFRSQRKNEDPHKLILKCKPDDDGKEDAIVVATSCSCQAG